MQGGTYVYLARSEAGLTQAQLAERVGRAQSEIARIERGRVRPSFETVRELVRGCGLELEISFARRDDSYRSEIGRLLELPPAERIERGLRRARQAQRLRRTTLAQSPS